MGLLLHGLVFEVEDVQDRLAQGVQRVGVDGLVDAVECALCIETLKRHVESHGPLVGLPCGGTRLSADYEMPAQAGIPPAQQGVFVVLLKTDVQLVARRGERRSGRLGAVAGRRWFGLPF
jgi:hypothetical protein